MIAHEQAQQTPESTSTNSLESNRPESTKPTSTDPLNSLDSRQNVYHSRMLTCVYFALLLGVLLLFFGYAYPGVPFWIDDWANLGYYGSLEPGADGWIPARILPKLLHSGLGVLSAYVLMPLTGLDFVDSMTCTIALALSLSTLTLCYLLYRLALLITRHQILALLSTSAFVIIGFCGSKASFMPLLLPADLQVEGLGYTLTITTFYILPNLLNLALLSALMYYQFSRSFFSTSAKNPNASKNFDPITRLVIIGATALALYLAQFSMTSAALILSTYCGAALLLHILAKIKQARTLSPITLIKSFRFYEFVLALCVLLFLVAVWYDMHGGRGAECSRFDFFYGISYTIQQLKSLRGGFWTLFIILAICMIYLAFIHKQLRIIIATQILWLVALVVAYMGIVMLASCGAKHYLMSGLLLSIALTACVWLALLLRFVPKLAAVATFIVLFSFLHPFQGYGERPRDAYLQHRAYAKAWVAQMQEAESKGLDSTTIFVPSTFPQWQFPRWFPYGFHLGLRQFGVIRRDIAVEFKPESSPPNKAPASSK